MTAPAHLERSSRGGWLAVAVVSAIAFTLLAIMVSVNDLTAIDTREILAVRSYASPGLTAAMRITSLIAGSLAAPLALLAAAALYRVARPAVAALYAGACAGGELLMLGIKAVVRHHRPVGISPKLTDAGWYSFPSGHTMAAVFIFGLAAWFLTRGASRGVRVGALGAAAVFVVVVGISRVYLGAHWPSDVVGGALGGLAWSALCVGAEPSTAPA